MTSPAPMANRIASQPGRGQAIPKQTICNFYVKPPSPSWFSLRCLQLTLLGSGFEHVSCVGLVLVYLLTTVHRLPLLQPFPHLDTSRYTRTTESTADEQRHPTDVFTIATEFYKLLKLNHDDNTSAL